uniref:Uncharacterized protein n=1 Tax=Arundo donax TaxID=35708 RepID=A0A0A9D446_ARUDO
MKCGHVIDVNGDIVATNNCAKLTVELEVGPDSMFASWVVGTVDVQPVVEGYYHHFTSGCSAHTARQTSWAVLAASQKVWVLPGTIDSMDLLVRSSDHCVFDQGKYVSSKHAVPFQPPWPPPRAGTTMLLWRVISLVEMIELKPWLGRLERPCIGGFILHRHGAITLPSSKKFQLACPVEDSACLHISVKMATDSNSLEIVKLQRKENDIERYFSLYFEVVILKGSLRGFASLVNATQFPVRVGLRRF